MNTKILIILTLMTSLIMTSCGKKENGVSNQDEITSDEYMQNLEDERSEDDNKVASPLDGLKYYKEDLEKRPVVVSIDNHPDARWQAGLSEAEIVYECEVEGSYTRYVCVFLAKEPELVGPIRSARPYLINYALENDGIFVHVGGSQDAFDEVRRLSVADIDGLYSGAMWRYYDTDKFAPHNMYTTLQSIREEAAKLGYRTDAKFEPYKFHDKNKKLSETYQTTQKSERINITYNYQNSTDYVYEEDKQIYSRIKDGEIHIDENTNEQITAKNIVVIQMQKKVLDNEGRLFLGTVGTGIGYYITEGEATNINWEKKSEKDRTKFYIDDKEITLNKGNTWIQIVSDIEGVTFE